MSPVVSTPLSTKGQEYKDQIHNIFVKQGITDGIKTGGLMLMNRRHKACKLMLLILRCHYWSTQILRLNFQCWSWLGKFLAVPVKSLSEGPGSSASPLWQKSSSSPNILLPPSKLQKKPLSDIKNVIIETQKVDRHVACLLILNCC